MICAVCGPLNRHDGEHCEKCHAAHDALWDSIDVYRLTDPETGRFIPTAGLDKSERPF